MRPRACSWLTPAALAALVGCGRLGFDATGDGGPHGDEVDGAAQDGAPGPDADTTPNLAFRTSGRFNGNLGGRAGADAQCQLAADSAGLGGTFVALLTTTAEAANVRLAGSRGWTDVTGVPLADDPADWAHSRLLNPLWRGPDGSLLPNNDSWIGDPGDGTCADWTSSASSNEASVALAGIPINPHATGGGVVFNASNGCNNTLSLICVGVGHVTTVAITPTEGRIAFASEAGYAPTAGVAGADAICAGEAASAGLPGSYLAAMSTSTASAESRFDLSAASLPWIRVDGARLTPTAADFFSDGAPLQETFINSNAAGQIQENRTIWADGLSQNCVDWSSTSSGENGVFGQVNSALRQQRTNFGSFSCNAVLSVLCLQE